jgi:hypothetical protein
MKPAHVKVAVLVVAVTAVEGADVREGEAVTEADVVVDGPMRGTAQVRKSVSCEG